MHSNPQELDQKRHHDNEGDRTNKRGCPTEIAKYSSLDIIVGAERGSAYGARGGTGGTWPLRAMYPLPSHVGQRSSLTATKNLRYKEGVTPLRRLSTAHFPVILDPRRVQDRNALRSHFQAARLAPTT